MDTHDAPPTPDACAPAALCDSAAPAKTTSPLGDRPTLQVEHAAPTTDTPPQEDPFAGMSKSQRKKLKKQMEKRARWEATKAETRKARKERKKERKRADPDSVPYRPRKRRAMETIETKGNVVIDCEFGDKMNASETKSLYNQIQFLYGANWKSPHPFVIRCLGMYPELAARVAKNNCANWKLITFEETPLATFKDMAPCVYLTAESETVLTELRDDVYYVIGGIVDHNKYKGLCLGKAQALGIPTARLPLDEHIAVLGRRVLTVNQVFDILATFKDTGNWRATLERVLPQRKLDHGGAGPAADGPDELSID